MNKPFEPKPYLFYGLLGAVVYSVPVAIFLSSPEYSQTWLLYLGNLLFLFVIVTFMFRFNRKRSENASTLAMLTAGHITTVMGIVAAVILAFLLLVILVPGYLSSGTTDKVLTGEPANTVYDKTRGMSFMVFATAIIGNLSAGSFVSIVFPFALKADQTRERVPRRKQAEL
jgi:Na+/proline symporter